MASVLSPSSAGKPITPDVSSKASAEMPKSPAPTRKIRFSVGMNYRVKRVIGEGAYGVVATAVHRPTGLKVAIKKIEPFGHQMFALRTLRELKLLCYFQECQASENIISILDIIKPASYDAFKEIYIVQHLMETDLHRVIRSQPLSDDHAQYFTYQLLRGLKAIHSADVMHRDLKPSNILVSTQCDLKIADFGLSRSIRTADKDTGFMTEYVATRWYRAPEIMLTFKQYSKAVDVWAVGCILAEMVTRKPLFPGRDYHDQVERILKVLGTPMLDDFYSIGSRRSRDYIRAQPLYKRQSFAELFPTATPECLDFLTKTLAFDPKKRPTVVELLAHPYVAAYHDPEDEPTCASLEPEFFHFDQEKDTCTTEQIRAETWEHINSFEPLLQTACERSVEFDAL